MSLYFVKSLIIDILHGSKYVSVKHDFLLKKIFRKYLNEPISLPEMSS